MAKNVLVVDDEPNIVLSLEFLMKRAGYQVRVAHDGEAALEEVRQKTPDLILLDLMIPKRDGYDVCQTLRSDPANDKIKIIMLTAKGLEAEREKGLSLGATAYITKPFATQDLVELVNRLLSAP